MNKLRRFFGILWMLMGPLAVFYLIKTAIHEISVKPDIDTQIQWIVFITIFLPISIGFLIFGWYAFNGEYDT